MLTSDGDMYSIAADVANDLKIDNHGLGFLRLLRLTSMARPNFRKAMIPRVKLCHFLGTYQPCLETIKRMLQDCAHGREPTVTHEFLFDMVREFVRIVDPFPVRVVLLSDQHLQTIGVHPIKSWIDIQGDSKLRLTEMLVTKLMRFTENLLHRIVRFILYFVQVLDRFSTLNRQEQTSLVDSLAEIRIPENAAPGAFVQSLFDQPPLSYQMLLSNLTVIVAYELDPGPRILHIVPAPPPSSRDVIYHPIGYIVTLVQEIAIRRNLTLMSCQEVIAQVRRLDEKQVSNLNQRCDACASCSAGCLPDKCQSGCSAVARVHQLLVLYYADNRNSELYKSIFRQ